MFYLRSVLQKEKLNRTNFLDWSRNLRIILKQEKKLLSINEAMPPKPANNANAAIKAAYEKCKNGSNEVICLMLVTMSPEWQKQFLEMETFSIHAHLTEMF